MGIAWITPDLRWPRTQTFSMNSASILTLPALLSALKSATSKTSGVVAVAWPARRFASCPFPVGLETFERAEGGRDPAGGGEEQPHATEMRQVVEARSSRGRPVRASFERGVRA